MTTAERCLVAVSAAIAAAWPSCAANEYGACAHLTYGEPPARTCAMMRQAGIGWVRSDFDWNAVERKKGEWNFDYFDRVVSECESAGVQLLPILKGHRESVVHGLLLDEWGEFVRRVVERYGRRLPVLEVWNEQNADGFNPTNYLAVLRRAYEAAKEADPAVRVAFGGTAGVPLDFVEGVYKWRSDDGRFYFPQWTRPDGVQAGMFWTVGDACDRKVSFTSDRMTFLDAAGARVRPEREGNVYALRVSESPIYFFGGELKTAEQAK